MHQFYSFIQDKTMLSNKHSTPDINNGMLAEKDPDQSDITSFANTTNSLQEKFIEATRWMLYTALPNRNNEFFFPMLQLFISLSPSEQDMRAVIKRVLASRYPDAIDLLVKLHFIIWYCNRISDGEKREAIGHVLSSRNVDAIKQLINAGLIIWYISNGNAMKKRKAAKKVLSSRCSIAKQVLDRYCTQYNALIDLVSAWCSHSTSELYKSSGKHLNRYVGINGSLNERVSRFIELNKSRLSLEAKMNTIPIILLLNQDLPSKVKELAVLSTLKIITKAWEHKYLASSPTTNDNVSTKASTQKKKRKNRHFSENVSDELSVKALIRRNRRKRQRFHNTRSCDCGMIQRNQNKALGVNLPQKSK